MGYVILRAFKLNLLPSLLLIVLFGVIAVVLIVPEVDLPDTAFQRDSSPLAIHALSHQAAQSIVSVGPFRTYFDFEDTPAPRRQLSEMLAKDPEDPSIQHEVLRC
jgi:hypothetical protein